MRRIFLDRLKVDLEFHCLAIFMRRIVAEKRIPVVFSQFRISRCSAHLDVDHRRFREDQELSLEHIPLFCQLTSELMLGWEGILALATCCFDRGG